ncbi:MAG TPA: PQQ-binding-like beta-propeller repeat protein [Pirellulales bacterium]|nr:PQQ-binding-like beta-propeller repeat protein [Pirellulales bacterium]
MIRYSFCLIFMIALSAAAATFADVRSGSGPAVAEWPQWRGPLRDGKSSDTGLIANLPESGPPVLWKASGLGAGFSSISIADGRIFTMGERGEDQFVIALSLADGRELWRTKIGAKWKDGNYSGPRGTPTVDGDLLYAVGTYGDLICAETKTGKVHWKKNFQTDFGGQMMSGWGFSESPLVDGNKLLCTPGGKQAAIVALDKKGGRLLWKAAVPDLGPKGKDGAAYSSIVVSEAAGTRQYVQLLGRGVVGIDANTGKFLWGYNKITNPTAAIPTPIPHGDYIFCTSGYGDGGAAVLKIVKHAKQFEAEEIWYHPAKELQNHHGGAVLVGEYLYFGHGHNKGIPVCVEFLTGRIVWEGDKRPPGSGSAAVVFADGNVYYRYQDGVVALIGATPEGYQLKGTFTIPNVEKPSWPHPVVLDGKLYIREQDALICYNVKA